MGKSLVLVPLLGKSLVLVPLLGKSLVLLPLLGKSLVLVPLLGKSLVLVPLQAVGSTVGLSYLQRSIYRYAPLKRWCPPTRLHGVVIPKTTIPPYTCLL